MRLLLFVAALGVLAVVSQQEPEEPLMNRVMPLIQASWDKCVAAGQCPDPTAKSVKGAKQECKGGQVVINGKVHSCHNVDLLSYVSVTELGSTVGLNDIWGWVDPADGREIAIVACRDGTSFVDVTDAINPVVMLWLPTQTVSSSWRDVKVYKNHAFIVSEATNHGMQIVDLTQVRNPTYLQTLNKTSSGIAIPKTTHYNKFGNCHNIAINEDTGHGYCIGATRTGTGYEICRGGPHVMDLADPGNPKFIRCFGDDGYTHDSQCVIYKGPDVAYQGREICFHFNEDTLTIVDVAENTILSRTAYDNNYYTHQGWLTEDQTHLLMDDELDEKYTSTKHTRTLIWNVVNLKNPRKLGQCLSPDQAIDHNLYIRGDIAYLSNYASGLKVYDVKNIGDAKLKQLGSFDVSPDYINVVDFHGSWSNYPYFPSQNLIVTSIERGLYVLKYNPTEEPRDLNCYA